MSTEIPRIPLQVIMTAANTVSRAREDACPPPEIMSVTIRATSMTVTATASTSDPNGSPTRCATSSAWWTAARTEAPRRRPMTATRAGPMSALQASATVIAPTAGTTRVQSRIHSGTR